MKGTLIRLAALLMALMLLPCAVAEEGLRGYSKQDGYVYLTLGTYPQTETGGVEPILWRVLEVADGKAYLVSEYVLAAHRIHGDYQEYANKPSNSKKPGFDGDFTKTELGQYLNGSFAADNFTTGELALIAPHETLGMFTLLCNDDVKNEAYGFGTNQRRKAWGTEWAKVDDSRGDDLFVYGSKYGNHSPYWLRDQSTSDARHARCTKQAGDVGRINVITVDLGMRPACWLDMSRVAIAGGAGTKDDPFRLATDASPAAGDMAAETPADAPLPTTATVTLQLPAGLPTEMWLNAGMMIVSGTGTAEDPYILDFNIPND